MHKLVCSRCLQRVNCLLPSLPSSSLPCSHPRSFSRWFALYEDVNHVELPISELPSSSSYSHTAPIGLNDQRSSMLRRSLSSSYVPTSADDSELGGREFVDDATSVFGMSTGSPSTSIYDLDSFATAEEANLEWPKMLDEGPLSRDLLPASSLRGSFPLRKPSRTLPEKEHVNRSSSGRSGQGVRSRFAPTPTVAAAAPAAHVAAAATPAVAVPHWAAAAAPVAAPAAAAAAPTVAAVAAAPAVAASHWSSAAMPVRQPRVERVQDTQLPSPLTSVDDAISHPVERSGEMDWRVLREITDARDFPALRLLMAESHWPKGRLPPSQLSQIFSMVIEGARDCEECRDVVRDFALASSRHCLPSHTLVQLAARSAREEGLERAKEALNFHHKAFIMAPMSLEQHFSNRRAAARLLWREVAKRRQKEEATQLYDLSVALGLVEGPREFVEETLRESSRDGASFSSLLREWKELGKKYGSPQQGMDTVVRAAMRLRGEEREDALDALSTLVCCSPSLKTEAFLVHIIMNLLEQGEEKAARVVYGMVAIHGKHWGEVLGEMRREQTLSNLSLVEKVAQLVTYGTIGSIKKSGGRKKGKKADGVAEEGVAAAAEEEVKVEEEKEKEEEREVDGVSEEMRAVVWRVMGGRQSEKRKKGPPKKEKRRAKVDHKAVHDQVVRIQMTWLQMETAINGTSGDGMRRLAEWSEFHHLVMPEKTTDLPPIEENESQPAKKESDV